MRQFFTFGFPIRVYDEIFSSSYFTIWRHITFAERFKCLVCDGRVLRCCLPLVYFKRTCTQSGHIRGNRRRYSGARSRHESTISSVSLAGTTIPVSESVRSPGITLDSPMSFDRHVDSLQDCLPTHPGTAAHPEVRHTRWFEEYRSGCGWLQTWLLQCSAVWCVWSQHKQTAASSELTGTCRSTRRHTVQRHAEPRRPPLASRQRQHQLQGRASDIQNIIHAPTHVSSRLALVPDHSTTPVLQRTQFTPGRWRLQDRVHGSRAFCHAAPTVWNSLPLDLTDDFNTGFLSTFKKDLKTHLILPSHVMVFSCSSVSPTEEKIFRWLTVLMSLSSNCSLT